MSDNHELDRLIDRALATYADAEPDPFLQTKISASAREITPPPRFWALSAAAACVACVLFALLVTHTGAPMHSLSGSDISPVARRTSAPVVVSPKHVSLGPPGAAHPAIRRIRRLRPAPELAPHLAVFPSPAPLSREEEALLALTAHPVTLRSESLPFAADFQNLSIPPISIAPIEIAELSAKEQTKPRE
jgi:hypothetical protein